MKYYGEKWDDIMILDYEQFLFRLNEMNRRQQMEIKAMREINKK